MAKAKRASARGKTVRASDENPHPQPLPARGRGGDCRTGAAKPEAAALSPKRKGGPIPGTPSPMRARLSPELQAHARRLYEQTEQYVSHIALDCGVDESVLRRMAKREGWVRFVARPRDLPPVAKLLAEVEALEASVSGNEAGAAALRGAQMSAPQGDGVTAVQDNIARFTQVVMAHLEEFEALRRNGKLIARQHIPTARAISILTEAFNRLQRLRAAVPGSSPHDASYADMPADLDQFRLDLARRIAAFMESRPDDDFADGAAAAAAGRAE